MTNFKKQALTCTLGILFLAGCSSKLDVFPQNDNTGDKVFSTPEGYDQAMAKVYGSFALTGNQAKAGQPDLPGGGDEGWSDFVRLMWKLQELPTDEAVITWGDPGLPDFHNMSWTSVNPFIRRAYFRPHVQIAYANNFIQEAAKVSSKGFAPEVVTRVNYFAAEARYLRAFDYWLLMDLFGRPAFTTVVTAQPPKQIERKALFEWIEKELLAIEPLLLPARQGQNPAYYGRADQAACWALLARLYLNAEVYTGQARWSDAAAYAKKVIDAGYTLAPDYRNLMVSDNDVVSGSEFIFTVRYDALLTQAYGGTTFLANAANSTGVFAFRKPLPGTGDTVKQSIVYGSSGWDGLKTTSALLSKFPNNGFNTANFLPDSTDRRAMFTRLYVARNNRRRDSLYVIDPELNSLASGLPQQGVRVWKYRNVSSTGALDADPGKTFSSADFPLFRLAEMYLIYAECAARGQADVALGVEYVNNLRRRAYGNNTGDISAANLTPDFVLEERSRELYWEGHRRTDLIRYNKFTSADYLWPFKGGVKAGKSVSDNLKLYPIPSNEMQANPNLTQNSGY